MDSKFERDVIKPLETDVYHAKQERDAAQEQYNKVAAELRGLQEALEAANSRLQRAEANLAAAKEGK